MARLISPTGITVNVSDEKAKRLLEAGYKSADKAPAKKAAASRKAAEPAEKSE